jgi:hypothetical protein
MLNASLRDGVIINKPIDFCNLKKPSKQSLTILEIASGKIIVVKEN